jgi:hypothetical protein
VCALNLKSRSNLVTPYRFTLGHVFVVNDAHRFHSYLTQFQVIYTDVNLSVPLLCMSSAYRRFRLDAAARAMVICTHRDSLAYMNSRGDFWRLHSYQVAA